MTVFKVELPDGMPELITSKRAITHCVVGINPHNDGKSSVYAKCGSKELAEKALAKEKRNCPWLVALKIVPAMALN